MTRWRIVELQPGDVVPPRVLVGLELVVDDPELVELVERAASAAGVTLARTCDPYDSGG